jgi:hypothetical protein
MRCSGDHAEDASTSASSLVTRLAHAAKRVADNPGKVETTISNVRTDAAL